jgi:hypothetical protein
MIAAARWPARNDPANNQFDLPTATGRIIRHAKRQEAGLATAESECLADADARERRAEREARRRSELVQAYVGEFARRVRELFPGCPSAGSERAIAEHACLRLMYTCPPIFLVDTYRRPSHVAKSRRLR